jgi:tRNA (guanosine-2'-O-)-methyltransferase
MQNDPFPYSGTVEVSRIALQPEAVWSMLSPHLTPARRQRIEAVAKRRSFAVATVLEQVHDNGNIAAVLRTCEAIGFPIVQLVRSPRAPGDKWRPPNRVSHGAQKWIEATWWDADSSWMQHLREKGYRVLVTRLGDGPTIEQVDFSHPTAVVFGNEHGGVTNATADAADGSFSIPMAGFTRSLNISVAVGMVLQHARNVRAETLGTDSDISTEQAQLLSAQYAVRSLPNAGSLVRRALSEGSFDISLLRHEGSSYDH